MDYLTDLWHDREKNKLKHHTLHYNTMQQPLTISLQCISNKLTPLSSELADSGCDTIQDLRAGSDVPDADSFSNNFNNAGKRRKQQEVGNATFNIFFQYIPLQIEFLNTSP